MSKPPEVEITDWDLAARQVRGLRMIQGYSQDDLAQRSGLAPKTVYRLERGMPTSRRSLVKICEALEVFPEQLCAVPLQSQVTKPVYGVHRREENVWIILGPDLRVKVPQDNFERTQRREERLRLGRQGLVAAFAATMSFMMPDGPGILTIEMYRRVEGPLNSTLYRECVLSCTRGRVRVGVGDDVIELDEGEALGYRSTDLRWMEPLAPVEDGLPTMLTWTGAVRVGNLPGDFRKGERVKRSR